MYGLKLYPGIMLKLKRKNESKWSDQEDKMQWDESNIIYIQHRHGLHKIDVQNVHVQNQGQGRPVSFGLLCSVVQNQSVRTEIGSSDREQKCVQCVSNSH
jgi:hypothetical protein